MVPHQENLYYINKKLYIIELPLKVQRNDTFPSQHGSPIPSGRKREQDLYVLRRVVCPQNAAWQNKTKRKQVSMPQPFLLSTIYTIIRNRV